MRPRRTSTARCPSRDADGAKDCEAKLKDNISKFESACRKHFGVD